MYLLVKSVYLSDGGTGTFSIKGCDSAHSHLGCTELCRLGTSDLCRAVWWRGRWPELSMAGCAWLRLCPLLHVMTAAMTAGQLQAGCRAAGLCVCLMTGARALLPPCLAQQAQSSDGLSPHPQGNSPKGSLREGASPGMREPGWARTRLLSIHPT